MNALADHVLVELYAQGDPRAAEELFQRHAGAVRSAVAARCGDDYGEEAVQEVFARLWQRPERFDPSRGSLRTFLISDGIGRAVDRWRSEAASRARTMAFEVESTPLAPEQTSVLREAGRVVRTALEDLTEGQRDAIYLAFYGGFTYKEVARRLGIPEGTAKGRIRSGLQSLSTVLRADGWNAALVD